MNKEFLSLMALISLGLMAVGVLSFIYGFFTRGFRWMGRGILTAVLGAALLVIIYFGGLLAGVGH